MSQPNEPKQFRVNITVTDEQGNELERKSDYNHAHNYDNVVEDLVDSFLEAEEL